MTDKSDRKNLKKRYLIWFYKTTKEALDKIERKFTQAEIDRAILHDLKKAGKKVPINSSVEQFEDYIAKKEQDGKSLKFENNKLKPHYLFLEKKLAAIEKTIAKELGKEALKEIKLLYELEMTERILRSSEH
jgi:protein required for attachment to host cells